MARLGAGFLRFILKGLNKIGIDARLPAEMMFMENFYQTQTLSTEKLKNSSYGIPDPEKSVFTELPSIIDYYITRWEHLNLISAYNVCFFDPLRQTEQFARAPDKLLEAIHNERIQPLADFEELRESNPAVKAENPPVS